MSLLEGYTCGVHLFPHERELVRQTKAKEIADDFARLYEKCVGWCAADGRYKSMIDYLGWQCERVSTFSVLYRMIENSGRKCSLDLTIVRVLSTEMTLFEESIPMPKRLTYRVRLCEIWQKWVAHKTTTQELCRTTLDVGVEPLWPRDYCRCCGAKMSCHNPCCPEVQSRG